MGEVREIFRLINDEYDDGNDLIKIDDWDGEQWIEIVFVVLFCFLVCFVYGSFEDSGLSVCFCFLLYMCVMFCLWMFMECLYNVYNRGGYT